MKTRELNRALWLTVVTVVLGACSSGRHAEQGPAAADLTGTEASAKAASEARPQGQSVTIKGSDTMVILAQKWAQAFMKEHPGAVLQVSGGGSGTGVAALINGTADLANASRKMKAKERKQLQESRGVEANEFRVALDSLAVYVHASNPIQSLTIPQLKKIFRAQATNWKELGGPDSRIVLYSRENNSGTYAYFKEHVLSKQDFAPTAQTLPGTAAVINAVSKDPNGIGYGGIAYSEGVRAIKVAPEGGEPVAPSMENATSGKYPISRFLHIYSAGEPTGVAKQYLDFVISDKGQSIVEGVGYYPLPKQEAAAAE